MSYLAVLDVETTGLNPYRHDRVIEVAAVVIDEDGRLVREFVTLVNPDRDIGPTSIHGLATDDVLGAPRFYEIASSLVDTLDGCCLIAGHNVRFDLTFLSAEFRRLNSTFPTDPTLCTMRLAGGGSLQACCSDFGVEFEGECHSALHDARATARLLSILLSDEPVLRTQVFANRPISLPATERFDAKLLSREESRRQQAVPPTFLMRLASRADDIAPLDLEDSTSLAYAAILDRALEDRTIDPQESETLFEVATRWGLSREQVYQIHEGYLRHLLVAALADGVVTETERRDLTLVTRLLGIESRRLDEMLNSACVKISEVMPPSYARADASDLVGKRVCFTGECQCRVVGGEEITRSLAAALATTRGLAVTEAVTKKLDLLVVSDPSTQSGKAKKARKYGIRILHEPVFWKMLGIEVA